MRGLFITYKHITYLHASNKNILPSTLCQCIDKIVCVSNAHNQYTMLLTHIAFGAKL